MCVHTVCVCMHNGTYQGVYGHTGAYGHVLSMYPTYIHATHCMQAPTPCRRSKSRHTAHDMLCARISPAMLNMQRPSPSACYAHGKHPCQWVGCTRERAYGPVFVQA